jgi:hypothetical protein
MKKVIFILIGISLMTVLFVGCGEKKSEGVLACEAAAVKLVETTPITEADGKLLTKGCAYYTGGPSDEEVGKFVIGKGMDKVIKDNNIK